MSIREGDAVSEPRTESGRMLMGLNRQTTGDFGEEAFDPDDLAQRIRSIETEAGSLDAALLAEAIITADARALDEGRTRPCSDASDYAYDAAAIAAEYQRLRETR